MAARYEHARAIILVEHQGTYMLAAILPDEMEVSSEPVDITTAMDTHRHFAPGGAPTYLRIGGHVVKALRSWGTEEEALGAILVDGQPLLRRLAP